MKKIKLLPMKVLNSLHRPFRTDANREPAKIEFDRWVAKANERKGLRVLEIGSRNVTGNMQRYRFPDAVEYVGVDVLDGENVDVVGDIHALSKLVPHNHFDVVFSAAVFEHLMFPWKAAMEVNRVLKTGGYVFTVTHPAWPEHEMPWDFWRFPKNAFKSLFNSVTGFEIMASEEGHAIRGLAMTTHYGMRKMYKHKLNGLVYNVAQKTGDYDTSRLKWDIVPDDVTDDMYPSLKRKAGQKNDTGRS
jgi:SAM-dependent methyltransferase